MNTNIICYCWGFISFWIFIDALTIYQELKLLTSLHKDLTDRYLLLDKDFKSLLKQNHERTRYLTNIIAENSLLLNDIKKIITTPPPIVVI